MGTEVETQDVEPDRRVEKHIWRYMGIRSAREMAADLGVSPEVVLRTKKALIDEVDVLTVQERRMRIMVELDEMAREARERAAKASDEFYAGGLNAATAALKALLVELGRADKADTGKVEALNQLRVQELVRLMNAVVTTGVEEVAGRYDLDRDELYDIFNDRLKIEAESQ